MEDIVIPHCFAQVLFLSILGDNLTYCIRSSALVVKFLSRSSHSEVCSRQPHCVPTFKVMSVQPA